MSLQLYLPKILPAGCGENPWCQLRGSVPVGLGVEPIYAQKGIARGLSVLVPAGEGEIGYGNEVEL